MGKAHIIMYIHNKQLKYNKHFVKQLNVKAKCI